MKEQQMACVVLILVIGGFLYGAQTFEQRMSAARREANASKEAADAAQQAFGTSKRALDVLTKSTVELSSFLEEWEPHLRATQSAQSTEQSIVDLVKQSDIFTESQRFEMLERRDDTVFKNALRAHIIVKDEYTKSMNWLASLEESLPTSRLSSLVVKRGDSGNDIQMTLVIDLPIAPAI
jgi:hypothetical protein